MHAEVAILEDRPDEPLQQPDQRGTSANDNYTALPTLNLESPGCYVDAAIATAGARYSL